MYLCVYIILFIFFSSIVLMMCIGTFKTFVKGILLAQGSGFFWSGPCDGNFSVRFDVLCVYNYMRVMLLVDLQGLATWTSMIDMT